MHVSCAGDGHGEVNTVSDAHPCIASLVGCSLFLSSRAWSWSTCTTMHGMFPGPGSNWAIRNITHNIEINAAGNFFLRHIEHIQFRDSESGLKSGPPNTANMATIEFENVQSPCLKSDKGKQWNCVGVVSVTRCR
jgi:hypothetical protein